MKYIFPILITLFMAANVCFSVERPQKLEVTNLGLILRGTVVGIPEAYAVIEDKKIRHQFLYKVGDSIQDAKIKKILRCKVILTYQGKDQMLEIQETSLDQIPEMEGENLKQIPGMEGKSSEQIPETGGNSKNNPVLRIPAGKTGLGKAPAGKILSEFLSDNINVLFKQVKFRPHIKDGQRDGLMVFGIRPDSGISQMGFRNGDILKDFNGIPITSSEDIPGLISEMIRADKAKITITRRGKIEEWIFQVGKDGVLLKSKVNE